MKGVTGLEEDLGNRLRVNLDLHLELHPWRDRPRVNLDVNPELLPWREFEDLPVAGVAAPPLRLPSTSLVLVCPPAMLIRKLYRTDRTRHRHVAGRKPVTC